MADPKWKAGVADMSLPMRDGARSYAVALSPAPLQTKGLTFMYRHYHLRRSEIPALERARSAVSERDRSDTQMRFECEPTGWFARGKVAQIVAQMLSADRSHRDLPTDGRGPQFAPVVQYSQC